MSDPAETLEHGLDEIGIPVAADQRRQLLELAELVDRWGARINLTGHRGVDAIVRRLVLDAAALVAALPEVPSVVDLGSGAGFPGLPIAILRPGCRVTLIDARERRHHFQRAACRALALRNAEPLRGRAEQLEPSAHAAAIAQAIARPDAAIELLLRWVGIGGMLLLPGGSDAPALDDPRIAADRIATYQVPLGGPRRTLWMGRRLR